MMNGRLFSFGLVVTLAAIVIVGCSRSDSAKKGDPESGGKAVTNVADTLVAKLYWLGKKQLAAGSGATNLMAVWSMPESVNLETQTLDKLSAIPWQVLKTAVPRSNAPVAHLRSLLDDLILEESYLEIHCTTNRQYDLLFAIRLSPDRAGVWQTNAAILLDSLAPTRNLSVAVSRSSDWTLLSLREPGQTLGSNANVSATADGLLKTFLSRIQRFGAPVQPSVSNCLIDVYVDVPRFATMLRLDGSVPLATFSGVMFGDAGMVRTRASLEFATPLSLSIEPWNIPTNLIHGPLVSFSAARAVQPVLEKMGNLWSTEKWGPPPKEAFFWAQGSAPWLHFCAVRSSNAEKQFLTLKDYLLEVINPALGPNEMGSFGWLTNESRVAWTGVPFFGPVFKLESGLITGGLAASSLTNTSMPPEFQQQLRNATNAIWYDWEMTGTQTDNWIQVGQLLRMCFSRAQLPIRQPGLRWLVSLGTNLTYSATAVNVENDRRLTFARTSDLGFNSIELHLLVDWLESPTFPVGINTTVAPRDYRKAKRPPGY